MSNLTFGDLYNINTPRPIFDKFTKGRKVIEGLDLNKFFIILEKQQEPEDFNSLGWYKILTTQGTIGWIYSNEYYFTKVLKAE